MVKPYLHIDVETYSSYNLFETGAHKYVTAPDFEILIISYSIKNISRTIDVASGEAIPESFIDMLKNPRIIKTAWNAQFERLCFNAIGLETKISEWFCVMIKAAYCGLPMSLDKAGKALGLPEDKLKDKEGKSFIRYFCVPCKATKVNGGRHRNLPKHDMHKWNGFKNYCDQDVVVEKQIFKKLEQYDLPDFEKKLYAIDQEINDYGFLVDKTFVKNAINIHNIRTAEIENEIKRITKVDNPNSAAQVKKWLSATTKIEIKSLAKDNIESLKKQLALAPCSDLTLKVLALRASGAKTSIKKYPRMLQCASAYDHAARGLAQFYGAGRTGRWAGRLAQPHNLPKNKIKSLALARNLVLKNDYDAMTLQYGEKVMTVLSELVRTAFVAPKNHTFAVADFSAIEARVVAWVADEKWRMDVFNTHGKIYEASASMMFNIPLGSIDKSSDLRQKGKVAELSLGYGGALGALKKMGGEKMGLSDSEMQSIVRKWRKASANIVKFWKACEKCAMTAVANKFTEIKQSKHLSYYCDNSNLQITLPSGRKLFYNKPQILNNKWNRPGLFYMGLNQTINKWVLIDTYGGKLTENIVQAIARDLLAFAIKNVHEKGFKIAMHVHDEIIAAVLKKTCSADFKQILSIMAKRPLWALDLPLEADGYLTEYYKKD